MEARKVQEIFNSTVIKNIEIEILSTQHEVDRRHFEYEAGEEVIKCLLGTRKSLLNKMFVMDEDSKQLLSDFNKALKVQLLEMRKHALSIYASNVNSGLSPVSVSEENASWAMTTLRLIQFRRCEPRRCGLY